MECLYEHKMKSLCQLGQCTNLHQPQQTDTFAVYGIHRTKIHVTAAVMVPLTITPRPVIENTHRGKTSHERLREQMVHNSFEMTALSSFHHTNRGANKNSGVCTAKLVGTRTSFHHTDRAATNIFVHFISRSDAQPNTPA